MTFTTPENVSPSTPVTWEWMQAYAESREQAAVVTYQPWQFVITGAEYGARGDGQVVLDGAMSSTSGTTTLTCATSSPFKAGDVGKAVMVKDALTHATGTTGVGTITSYISPSQVTVSFACTSTVSGATVMWASDDTAAVQAAINAAAAWLAAGHPYAQVFVPVAPAGQFYGIAGPLVHANSANGQLTIPVSGVTGDCVTLEICGAGSGAAIRHWLQTTPQLGPSALVSFGAYASASAQASDIDVNGQSAMISGPNGAHGYGTGTFLFSNMLLIVRNLTLVTTHSNFGLTYGALWAWGIVQCNVIDVGYGTAAIFDNGSGDLGGSGVSTLSSGASIGIGMPAPSNQNNVVCRSVTCGGGYTYGLFAAEHSDMQGCHIFYCWAGLCAVGSWSDGGGSTNASDHKIRWTQFGIEGCTHSLMIIGEGSGGLGPFIEGSIDCESGLSVADNNSGLGLAAAAGEIHLTGTTGSTLSTTAGTSLTIIDERKANGPQGTWSLTVGTAFQNTQWRWAAVYLSGGTSLTAVQAGNLRGGSAAPSMTTVYSQSAGALPALTVRVPPGGWLQVNGTGSPAPPTANVVYD